MKPVKGLNENIAFTAPLSEMLMNMAVDVNTVFDFKSDGLIAKLIGMSPIIMKCETSSFLGWKTYKCYISVDNIKQAIDYNKYESLYNMIGLKKSYNKSAK